MVRASPRKAPPSAAVAGVTQHEKKGHFSSLPDIIENYNNTFWVRILIASVGISFLVLYVDRQGMVEYGSIALKGVTSQRKDTMMTSIIEKQRNDEEKNRKGAEDPTTINSAVAFDARDDVQKVADQASIPENSQCTAECQNPTFDDLKAFGGDDILQPDTMLKRLQEGRRHWINTDIKKKYGEETYLDIFYPEEGDDVEGNKTRVSVGRRRILDDPNQIIANKAKKRPTMSDIDSNQTEPPLQLPAWGRMVKKYQMKIIQLQLAIIQERLEKQTVCMQECSAQQQRQLRWLQDSTSSRSNSGIDSNKRKKTDTYGNYLWITMGMSSAAGHGNLFDESYTIVMDTALKPIMKQIGLDFEARSYAMGGSSGAPQLALCMNSIAGSSVDHITWDFGQTDGRDYWRLVMFAYRAAMISQHPNAVSQPGNVPYRPSLFVMHPADECVEIAKEMQTLGMDTLTWNSAYMKSKVMEAVPDMEGMSDQQIEQVPENLRYFKCGRMTENGEPGCADHRWNNTVCTNRRYRVAWHPGWKIHALEGNLLAMTVLDLWEDAIQHLIDMEPSEPETLMQRKERLEVLLRQIDQEDKAKYDNIFESPIPERLEKVVDKWWTGDRADRMADMSKESFMKAPAFCEFASLPADIRLRNFYTENLTATPGKYTDLTSFEAGIDYNFLREFEINISSPAYPWRGDKIKLIQNSRDHQEPCKADLHFDFKDVFMVSSVEGKRRLTIPNNSEKKHYVEFDAAKSKGYVLACVQRVSSILIWRINFRSLILVSQSFLPVFWGLQCDFFNCEKGDFYEYFGSFDRPNKMLPEEEINQMGRVEITINGEPVTEITEMDWQKCNALKNKDGHRWKPNQSGQYEIEMEITNATIYSFVRLSSFILL